MALEYCSVMPHQPHLLWVPPHLRDITRRAAFLIRSGKKEQLERCRRRHPWPRKIWEKESQQAFCLRRVLSLLIQRGFFLVQVCFRKWRERNLLLHPLSWGEQVSYRLLPEHYKTTGAQPAAIPMGVTQVSPMFNTTGSLMVP